MVHRDDREALRAKVDSLQRELAEVHAERDKEQARPPRRSIGLRISAALARVLDRALTMWTAITTTPAKWTKGRAWGFGAVAASVLGGTLLMMLIWGAATEGAYELTPIDIAFMVWALVGAPIALGLAALAFRAPGSALWTGAGACCVIVLATLITGAVPAVRDAPRLLLLGRAQGTVEAVGAAPAVGWAEIAPAYVWVDRMGTASTTFLRNGREETTSSAASPIVPAIPWAGTTSLFACGDQNLLRLSGAGSGALAGRVELAGGLELEAIQRTGVQVGPQPRCVTTTIGGANVTLALGLAWMLVWLAVFALGGARALMGIAAADPA